MYIHLEWYFWLAILGANAWAAGLLVWSLPPRARAGVAAFIGIWFAADIAFAARGVFQYSAQNPFPYLALGVSAPLVVGVLALRTFGSLRAAFDAVPQHRLIKIQTFRAIGFTFLILLTQHRLPAVFALPAGIGDVLVGLDALAVANAFYKNSKWAPAAGIVWNILGVIDLLVAISIGFLASTTPLRLIFSTPSTNLLTFLPLVMVPVFAVPLFLLIHGISITRIISKAGAQKSGFTPELLREPASLQAGARLDSR